MKDIWKPGTKVTPQDIREAREAAIARGADREQLEKLHRELVEHYGSEKKLAEAWTLQNMRAAFREQLDLFGAPGTPYSQ